MLDVDALHPRSARDEDEAERDTEHEGATRSLLRGQITVSRRAPPGDLPSQGGLDRGCEFGLELRDDEELDSGLHLRRGMSELIHDGDEALAIGSRVQEAGRGQELKDETAQGGFHRLGPGGRRQRRAPGVPVLQRATRGARLTGHPSEREVAPPLVGCYPHGCSTEGAIGAPDARRLE